jgi:tRNA A37 N6-isopentenylltransferase MiaA
MARGWESKSIEAQQAEASNERSQPRPKLTAQQAARKRQIDGLVLSLQRVRQQLAAAQDPRLRQMLESALTELEDRLRDLQTD